MERKTELILIGTIGILAVLFAVSFPYIFAIRISDVEDLKIKVLTDKTTYEKGETINITPYIVNDKIVAMSLGGYSVTWRVEEENGRVVFDSDGIINVDFFGVIMPSYSQSKLSDLEWNQRMDEGEQAPSGTYQIIVFLDGFQGETIIQIV